MKAFIKYQYSKVNGNFIIPAATLYPHQWSWDAAFNAIGNSYFNTDRSIKRIGILV